MLPPILVLEQNARRKLYHLLSACNEFRIINGYAYFSITLPTRTPILTLPESEESAFSDRCSTSTNMTKAELGRPREADYQVRRLLLSGGHKVKRRRCAVACARILIQLSGGGGAAGKWVVLQISCVLLSSLPHTVYLPPNRGLIHRLLGEEG